MTGEDITLLCLGIVTGVFVPDIISWIRSWWRLRWAKRNAERWKRMKQPNATSNRDTDA